MVRVASAAFLPLSDNFAPGLNAEAHLAHILCFAVRRAMSCCTRLCDRAGDTMVLRGDLPTLPRSQGEPVPKGEPVSDSNRGIRLWIRLGHCW